MTYCEFPVPPGITHEEVKWFTEGECALLATRIHEKTGWQMASLSQSWDCRPHSHVFVLLPNGRALDVEGICDQEEMQKRHGFREDRVILTSPDDLTSWGWMSGWYTEAHAHIGRIADLLITLATEEPDLASYATANQPQLGQT